MLGMVLCCGCSQRGNLVSAQTHASPLKYEHAQMHACTPSGVPNFNIIHGIKALDNSETTKPLLFVPTRTSWYHDTNSDLKLSFV